MMKALVKFLNLGIVIILCLLAGVAIGHLVDMAFNLGVVGKFVGLLAGTLLGLMYLWKIGKDG